MSNPKSEQENPKSKQEKVNLHKRPKKPGQEKPLSKEEASLKDLDKQKQEKAEKEKKEKEKTNYEKATKEMFTSGQTYLVGLQAFQKTLKEKNNADNLIKILGKIRAEELQRHLSNAISAAESALKSMQASFYKNTAPFDPLKTELLSKEEIER